MHEFNVIIWGNDCAKWQTVVQAVTVVDAMIKASHEFNRISIELIARVEVLNITLYNKSESTRKNVEDDLTATKMSKEQLA